MVKQYDPAKPVICLDETSRQLIEETRATLPAPPGKTAKVDYEYRRNGVVDLFMMFEPLSGQRYVEVTNTRRREDNVSPRVCFKTVRVTKQGTRQGRQQHENRVPSSHIWWRNGGCF